MLGTWVWWWPPSQEPSGSITPKPWPKNEIQQAYHTTEKPKKPTSTIKTLEKPRNTLEQPRKTLEKVVGRKKQK